MAKIKTFLVPVLAMLMIFGLLSMVAGCSDDNQTAEEEITGTFYSLQEAYDFGFLTTDDLQTIADYHNNGIPYTENIDEKIEKSLKEVWAKDLSESENDSSLTGEDVTIRKYYGVYNSCVIVILEKTGSTYAAIYAPYSVEIGNVTFNYSYPLPEIVVYKF